MAAGTLFLNNLATTSNELSKKTGNILRHQKECHEEDGACAWEKNKNFISQMPKIKNITPYHWLEQLTDASLAGISSVSWRMMVTWRRRTKVSCRLKKGTNYAGTLTRWRRPHATFGTSLSITELGPFVTRATEFLLAPDPRVRHCEGALPCWLRHIRKRPQRNRGRTRRLRSKTKVNKQFTFTLVSAMDKQNPTKKYKACSKRRDVRCGHGRRAEKGPQVRPNARWLRYLYRHDPPRVHQESHPHQGQSRYFLKPGFEVQLHTFRQGRTWQRRMRWLSTAILC